MSTQNPWAKLIPINPDKELVNFYTESSEDPAEGKWKIYQKSSGETWIINLSTLPIRVDETWLEFNQEKQLFNGERIAFCQNSKKKKSFDYVFCLMSPQDKNGLKRNREDGSSEPSNQRPLEKFVKINSSIQEAEITCSICLGILTRCATLGSCGHSLCAHCLIDHLKNSSFCPVCNCKIVSVIKISTLNNLIEAAVKNVPSSSNEAIIPLQKDLGGHVHINGREIFIGSILYGKREGQGTLISPNGQIHQCMWKNGLKEGEGVWILNDRTFVKGSWLHDYLQLHVEIKFANGNFYKGDLKDGKLDGKGIYKYSNGETYEGDFRGDCLEGFGKFSYQNGDKYEGDWLQGQRHGFGTMKYSDGGVYNGNWKNHIREGEGIQTFSNGDKYEGTWANDSWNGVGRYIWAYGTEYEGNWTDGLRDGNGTMKYLDGNTFKGEWENDQKHGKGVYILKDGRKVEGEWINSIRQPVVNIEYPNGNRYEGRIKNEDSFEKHGNGVLFFNNGGHFDGQWDNDREIGEGKYTLECASRTYEELWEGGRVCDSTLTLADGTKYEAVWKEVKKEKQIKGGKKSK